MSHRLPFDIVAFDADDTLWHEIEHYHAAEERIMTLLGRYAPEAAVRQQMGETDVRNIALYGYGAKGFILSMVETAIAVSDGQVTGEQIAEIIEIGKTVLSAPLTLIAGVQETLTALAGTYPMMIITKGDLHAQESKIIRSGLAEQFAHIEIVSDKSPDSYRKILQRYGYSAERFLMIGNSLRSDVMPVCAIGGHAIWLHQANTWSHEQLPDVDKTHFNTLDSITDVPNWLRQRENSAQA